MILYLIRHGHAEERTSWHRPDMERPLVNKGHERADKAFLKFFSTNKEPEIILTSEAVRAEETAEILLRHCKDAKLIMKEELNPGADNAAYSAVLEEYKDCSALAIVGHEPDMSEFASHILSGGLMDIRLKKGSIIHIQDGCLVNVVQQKVLL